MLFHRFPVEYQMDSQDCGPASLKIIAKHFGKFYSLQFMRDRCGEAGIKKVKTKAYCLPYRPN